MLHIVEFGLKEDGTPKDFPQPLPDSEPNLQADSILDAIKDIDKHASLYKDYAKRNLHLTSFSLNTERNEIYGLDQKVIDEIGIIPFRIKCITNRGAGAAIGVTLMEVLGLDTAQVTDLTIIESSFEVWIALHLSQTSTEFAETDFIESKDIYSLRCAELETKLRAEHPLCARVVVDNMWKKDSFIPLPGALYIDKIGHESTAKLIQVGVDNFSLLCLAPSENSTADLPETVKSFPPPDTDAVLSSCLFLKKIKDEENPPEKERLAAYSVLSRLYGEKETIRGQDLAHEWSREWQGYDNVKVGAQVAHQMGFGPRTCNNVHKTWGDNSKCKECPYFGKVKSPIAIKGKEYIQTKGSGFYFLDISKEGKTTRRPDFEGLRRFLYQKRPYIVMKDNGEIYEWTGKKWKVMYDTEINAFAEMYFDPKPKASQVAEFLSLVLRTELRDRDFFNETTEGKMNFENGVLDVHTLKFEEHSTRYGFRHVLPYDYDKSATCPRFDQFIDEITVNRADDLGKLLREFMGYSLSGDPYWEQKCMVLIGEGQNGKSVLMQVLQALSGEDTDSYSMMSFKDLKQPQNKAALDGALFNISEETPSDSIMDSSDFKLLIGGNRITVKKLYKDPFKIVNRAKFWMLCNTLPRSGDKSWALLRRLIIVPFDRIFDKESQDKRLSEKLKLELPGILNSVVEAYREMKKRGGHTQSAVVGEQIERYRMNNDNVLRFWKEYVIVQDEGTTNDYEFMDELYTCYKNYVEEEQNEKPTSKVSFFSRIESFFPELESRKSRKYVGPARQKAAITCIKIHEEIRDKYLRK